MDIKTPLYLKHFNLNATFTNFSNYLMPLYYTSINLEHNLVREDVGMFDVSHMGKILIKGKDTYKFLNYSLSNKISYSNKLIYSLLLNDEGFVVDDLMVYPLSNDEALLVVNAGNKETDFKQLNDLKKDFDITLSNLDDKYAIIALQGPNSESKIKEILKEYPKDYMTYLKTKFSAEDILISRSGYSGEDGFEIYGSPNLINHLWDLLYQNNVKPVGLGARDTLRFEASFPLYGNELSLKINPLEAGLGFAVKFDKDDFVGKSSLLKVKDNLTRKLVGIKLLERNVARTNYLVYSDNVEIGYITTGYFSPSLKIPIALALININYAKINNRVDVLIRGKNIPAKIINKNFLKIRKESQKWQKMMYYI